MPRMQTDAPAGGALWPLVGSRRVHRELYFLSAGATIRLVISIAGG